MPGGGSPGVRKVSAFLVDRKVPRAQRDRVPILVCGDGIVRAVGHRIEEAAKVGPAMRRALRARAEPASDR